MSLAPVPAPVPGPPSVRHLVGTESSRRAPDRAHAIGQKLDSRPSRHRDMTDAGGLKAARRSSRSRQRDELPPCHLGGTRSRPAEKECESAEDALRTPDAPRFYNEPPRTRRASSVVDQSESTMPATRPSSRQESNDSITLPIPLTPRHGTLPGPSRAGARLTGRTPWGKSWIRGPHWIGI